jgi:hypothetical protein
MGTCWLDGGSCVGMFGLDLSLDSAAVGFDLVFSVSIDSGGGSLGVGMAARM